MHRILTMGDLVKLFSALAALAVLAVSFFLLLRNNELQPAAVRTTYASAHYGYQFAYDPAFTLVEYTPEYQSIQDLSAPEPNEVVEIAVEESDADRAYDSFDDFVYTRAVAYCAADGPNESLYCTRLSKSQPFTSATGLDGSIFYLTHEHRIADTVTVGEAGPFYAFDISDGGAAYRALIVRPADFIGPGERHETGSEVANDIVNTIRRIR